jgi:uncharacterized membrane protein
VLDAFAKWLLTTRLSAFVTGRPWVWPASETLHFIGLCLLVGAVGVIDLRMLGVARRIPFAPLFRLVRWAVLGFVINLVTGILFFAGHPEQYIHNGAFQLKMVLVLLAGLNVVLFNLTVFRKTAVLGAGESAPPGAQVVAAVSLFLWFGVMYLGRMLPYIGNSF